MARKKGYVYLSWTVRHPRDNAAMIGVMKALDRLNIQYFDYTEYQTLDTSDKSDEIRQTIKAAVDCSSCSIEIISADNLMHRWVQVERGFLRERGIQRFFLCSDGMYMNHVAHNNEHLINRIDISNGRAGVIILDKHAILNNHLSYSDFSYYLTREYAKKCKSLSSTINSALPWLDQELPSQLQKTNRRVYEALEHDVDVEIPEGWIVDKSASLYNPDVCLSIRKERKYSTKIEIARTNRVKDHAPEAARAFAKTFLEEQRWSLLEDEIKIINDSPSYVFFYKHRAWQRFLGYKYYAKASVVVHNIEYLVEMATNELDIDKTIYYELLESIIVHRRPARYILYASKDVLFVTQLNLYLKRFGMHCMITDEEGKLSKPSVLNRKPREGDQLILVLSKHSVDCQWVEAFAKIGLEYEERTGQASLFLVRLDHSLKESPRYPVEGRDHAIIDFTRWTNLKDFKDAFGDLWLSLRGSL